MIKRAVLCLLPTLLLAGCGGTPKAAKTSATTLDSSARTFCHDVKNAYLSNEGTATAAEIQNQGHLLVDAGTVGRRSSNLTIRGLALILDNSNPTIGMRDQYAKDDVKVCQAQGLS